MSKRSISIVSTQMQLVNCIEAISHYGYNQNDLIIWAYSPLREKQLTTLMQRFNYRSFFRKVTVYTRHNCEGLKSIRSVYDERRFFNNYHVEKYNAIILGNYKLLQEKFFLKRVLRLNQDIKVIVVDDGLAICETISLREKECQEKKIHFDRVSKLYYIFYIDAFIRKWSPVGSVDFFTSYSGINCCDADNMTNNLYGYIKQYINSNDDESLYPYDIVFLGQPLVQLNLLTTEQYSNYILNELNHFSGTAKKIAYISHPVEKVELSLTKELSLELTIKRFDLPIELYLLALNDKKKTKVIGFYTSALVNLAQMQNRSNFEVSAIYIKEINDLSDENQKRIINNAYKYIENAGISIR